MRAIIEISKQSIYSPCIFDLPILGFADYVVGISGFEDHHRAWIGRIISIFGAQFTEKFSRKNTHLIVSSGSPMSVKMQKAEEWDIIIVLDDWVYACLEKGSVVDVKPYKYKIVIEHAPNPAPINMRRVNSALENSKVVAKTG